MKRNGKILLGYLPWLLLLLAVDSFTVLLLWIADAKALASMALVLLLSTLFLFLCVCTALLLRERKRYHAFLAFLSSPDAYHQQLLCKAVGTAQRESVELLGQTLRQYQTSYTDLQETLSDYQQYVESWAHETKTPLSLLTLLLDNHREEMSPDMGFKLDYIRSRTQESVEQMLFYARIKGSGKDYLFEPISIRSCTQEVLENYKPLLDEKNFSVTCNLPGCSVYSDRRGLQFLLGQLVSNSINYCSSEPRLSVSCQQEGDRQVLTLRDNGIGVRSCDLPYIFEKGFTGDTGDGRKKATGMGLYLVSEIAKDLAITLDVRSQWQEGFQIQLRFPIITDTNP